MSELSITDETFDEVINKGGVVLVDFWAPWCGPCRMVGPIVEDIAHEYEGRVTVAKMNVDENQLIPQRFGIMSIPTLIFFKNGSEVDKVVGAHPKEHLTTILDKHL